MTKRKKPADKNPLEMPFEEAMQPEGCEGEA